MGLTDTAELAVQLTLRDDLSLGLGRAKDAVGNFGDAARTTFANAADTATMTAGKIGNAFDAGRGKIREFSRAGTELAVVAAALGPDFEKALGPAGQFIHILGDAGLVVSAVADLGPAALRAVSGTVALGAASAEAAVGIAAEAGAATAAIPALEGAAAAEGAVTAGAVGLGAALLPLGIVIGGVALALGEIRQSDERLSEAQSKLADGTANLYDKQAILYQRTHAAAGAAQDHGKAMSDEARDAVTLAGVLDALSDHVTGRLVEAYRLLNTTVGAGTVDAFAAAQTGAGGFAVSADEAAKAAASLQGDVESATGDLNLMATALDALPRDISIKVNVGLTGAGAGVFAQGFPTTDTPAGNTDFGSVFGSTGDLTGTAGDPTKVAADAARAAAQAARDAAQAAADHARVVKQQEVEAFQAAKQAGDDFFASQHQKALAAIDDQLKLAKSIRDTAVANANAALQSALAANAAPVNAAEAALQAREQREQRINLVESVAQAQARAQANPQDVGAQQAFRNAVESLQNFDAQVEINTLKAKQATADAAATQTANAAIIAANTQYATAEAQAAADRTKADAVYAANRKKFDDGLAAIEKNVLAHSVGIAGATKAIQKAFEDLVTSKGTLNLHGINSAAPISVTVTLPPIILNGRAVSAAISATSSPTQSSSVRTGQATPVAHATV